MYLDILRGRLADVEAAFNRQISKNIKTLEGARTSQYTRRLRHVHARMFKHVRAMIDLSRAIMNEEFRLAQQADIPIAEMEVTS